MRQARYARERRRRPFDADAPEAARVAAAAAAAAAAATTEVVAAAAQCARSAGAALASAYPAAQSKAQQRVWRTAALLRCCGGQILLSDLLQQGLLICHPKHRVRLLLEMGVPTSERVRSLGFLSTPPGELGAHTPHFMLIKRAFTQVQPEHASREPKQRCHKEASRHS